MNILETNRVEEIANLISQAANEGKEFIVWQRNNCGKLSFQIKGKLGAITSDEQFLIKLDSEAEIDPYRPLYFAVLETSLAFKTDQAIINKDELLISAPAKIHYKERRKHERKKFRKKDIKHIEIFYSPNIEIEGEPSMFLTTMLDISDGGLCILISAEELEKINQAEHLGLNCLTSDVKLGSQKAKIVHKRKYNGKGLGLGNLYALGLSFI